ncbi:MAG: hypothetical protein F6K47_19525 [Symploca sp. SIO2E6]|nr:hypothetical protein [Symploca sp. SIO2E6]
MTQFNHSLYHFHTINNFQFSQTNLELRPKSNTNKLIIIDGINGAEIHVGLDLLAIVSGRQSSTIKNNLSWLKGLLI